MPLRHLTFVMMLGLGCLPRVAQAGIETMGRVRDEDRNCGRPHEQQALWRSRDGAIRLAGGGTRRFEFYGQFIDLTRDASVSGIPGASARAVRGVGGGTNSARRCGNIGSLVVEITLPDVESANTGTLTIGNDRVSITALPYTLRGVSWHRSNVARRQAGRSSTSSAPASGSTQPAGMITSSAQPCLPPTCDPTRPGNSMVLPRGNAGGGAPPYLSFSDCVARLGGSGTVSGRTLTIELPAQRNAQDIVNCGTYESPIEMTLTADRAHAFMTEFVGASSGSLPMPTLTTTGAGAPASILCLKAQTGSTVRKCPLENGVGPAVSIPSEALRSVTGTQTQTLRFALGGTTQTLNLVVRAQ